MAGSITAYSKQYALALAWALFILFATIASTSTLRSLSLGKLFSYDKLIHMVLFGIQAFLLVRARLKSEYGSYFRVIAWCCTISAVFGALTEVMQGLLTTTRMFDYYDMMADVAGSLVVFLFCFFKRPAP